MVDKTETTIISESRDENADKAANRCLPDLKFQERYDAIQEDVRIKSHNNTLAHIDITKPEVMSFIAKMKQHPVGIISAFAQAKQLPICNYFCYEVPAQQKYASELFDF